MKRAFVYILLMVSLAYVQAAPLETDASTSAVSIQGGRSIMASGSRYASQTYEAFSTEVPSQYTEFSTYQNANSPKPVLRRGFDTGGEYGQGPTPIGEPWVLAVFAAIMAGIIAWKRKHVRGTTGK